MTKRSGFNFPGIYLFTNKINGKVYVGQAINIRKRRTAHYYALRRNNHRNRYFQRAWNKNGEENFMFTVIENLSLIPDNQLASALDEAEIRWLIHYQNNSYNLMQVTSHGIRATPELSEWFKQHHTHWWSIDEHRARKIASITASYDHGNLRQRRSETSKSYANQPEVKSRVSNHFRQIWQDENHRTKQSAKRKANWQQQDYIDRQYASRVASWADDQKRENRLIGLRRAAKDPEVIRKRREGSLKTWAEKKARGETNWSPERKLEHSRKLREARIRRLNAAQSLDASHPVPREDE